jgi:hypothetical protein
MTDRMGSSGIEHVNSIALANIYCFFNSPLFHARALRVSRKEAQVFLCFVIKGFFLLCLFALYFFAPLRCVTNEKNKDSSFQC